MWDGEECWTHTSRNCGKVRFAWLEASLEEDFEIGLWDAGNTTRSQYPFQERGMTWIYRGLRSERDIGRPGCDSYYVLDEWFEREVKPRLRGRADGDGSSWYWGRFRKGNSVVKQKTASSRLSLAVWSIAQ